MITKMSIKIGNDNVSKREFEDNMHSQYIYKDGQFREYIFQSDAGSESDFFLILIRKIRESRNFFDNEIWVRPR